MDRREALVLLRSPRWRYLIDIIVLVAVTFILDAILGALVPEPISWNTGFVLDAIGKSCWSALDADSSCYPATDWPTSD